MIFYHFSPVCEWARRQGRLTAGSKIDISTVLAATSQPDPWRLGPVVWLTTNPDCGHNLCGVGTRYMRLTLIVPKSDRQLRPLASISNKVFRERGISRAEYTRGTCDDLQSTCGISRDDAMHLVCDAFRHWWVYQGDIAHERLTACEAVDRAPWWVWDGDCLASAA